jgi:assimilatory nitrate reductase catalytic subunit
MGPFSVTGQPNAMGGREADGLANQLACHMELDDPGHRAIVEAFWKVPSIADREGLKAVDLFDAVADGRIKALWIMATNPADSMPDAARVEAALAACPFVVVSDVEAVTDTARHAHVLLPAAAWGEKDGTVTNSERRISRQRSFLKPPGEARPDWWIVSQVARRMGFARAFDYGSPAQIFREYAALSAHCNSGARDFDIGGLADLADADYARLAPVQWPVPRDPCATAGGRFFADGGFFTPDRRARFVATAGLPANRSDPAFPLILNTGRVRDHWHTMTRTARSARLSAHIAEPYVEIHPSDAADAGIGAADLVTVESARGRVVLRAQLTDKQQPGVVFAPMHWTDQHASAARVDTLVASANDPVSGQPGLKYTPVRVARFEASWFGFAVLERRPEAVAADYWAVARVKSGWRLEIASRTEPEDWAGFARRLAGAAGAGADVVTYTDTANGIRRFAVTDGGRLTGALFTSRDPVAVARSWAAGALGTAVTDLTNRYRILAGRAGGDRPDSGAIVCSCFEVGINQIVEAVASGRCTSVDEVGRALRAGTNCGSCRGEIAGLIADAARARAG